MFYYSIYSAEVLEQLYEQGATEEDVTLITSDDKDLRASKEILATFSLFFRDLFG